MKADVPEYSTYKFVPITICDHTQPFASDKKNRKFKYPTTDVQMETKSPPEVLTPEDVVFMSMLNECQRKGQIRNYALPGFSGKA